MSEPPSVMSVPTCSSPHVLSNMGWGGVTVDGDVGIVTANLTKQEYQHDDDIL